MQYYCEKCGKLYTLPEGDVMISKEHVCDCGENSIEFKLVSITRMVENNPLHLTEIMV